MNPSKLVLSTKQSSSVPTATPLFPLDYSGFHDGELTPTLDDDDDDDDDDALFEEEVDNFLAWTGAEPLKPNTIFILVMGMTGSGKSTFISRCTGKNVRIGHDLFSCTNSLGIFSFKYGEMNVNLIDTPGFDDTNRSDIDTLKVISHYLSVSYSNSIFISGIIYLHRISDNRVSGTAKRNIEMLKGLCGSHAFRNVIIATTMWKGSEGMEELKKENQLRTESSFFGDMLSSGAQLFRHAANGGGPEEEKESALDIVSYIIDASRSFKFALQIQRELVDQGKLLNESTAGKVLLAEIQVANETFREQLEQVQREMNEARRRQENDLVSNLRGVERDFQQKLSRAENDSTALVTSLIDMHKEEQRRLLAKLEDVERQRTAELTARKVELQDLEESLKHIVEQSEKERRRYQRYRSKTEQKLKRAETDRELAEEGKAAVQILKNRVRKLDCGARTTQKASGRVRTALASGLVNGVASGTIAAVSATALAAGFLCVVS